MYINALTVLGNSLFAGSFGSVYHSDNNGTDWIPFDSPDPTGIILAMAGCDSTVYAAIQQNDPFLSRDKGQSWIPIVSGTGSFVSCFAVDGTTLYAGSNNGMINASSDNGRNWTTIRYGSCQSSGIFSMITIGSEIVVGTGSGIILSDLNGDNWVTANEGMGGFVGSFAMDNSTLYAGTQGSGVWKRPLAELLGVNENHSSARIKVYPDPVDRTLYISLPEDQNFKADLLTPDGKILQRLLLPNPLNAIDVSGFPPGIYFLRILNDHFMTTKKWIKL